MTLADQILYLCARANRSRPHTPARLQALCQQPVPWGADFGVRAGA